MSPRPIAFVLNMHSRMARRRPKHAEELEKAFQDRGPFIMSPTVSDLARSVQDIRRVDPRLIFICGGDGTLRQTLTHIIAEYVGSPLPQIVPLRGGTMNTVATSFGITNSPIEQLRAVLGKIDNGAPLEVVRRNLLEVNQHHGFIFGIGGFSRFIEHYQSEKDPSPLHAFKLLSKTIFSMLAGGSLASGFFEKFEANVFKDQQPWLLKSKFTSISASMIRDIGFRFKPYYGAGVDGAFGVLIFHSIPTRLVFHLPWIYLGKPIENSSIVQVSAHELLVKTEQLMRPMLDGDILKADREFVVKSGPELEFVVG